MDEQTRKDIQEHTKEDGSTDWGKLEAGETHGLFLYRRGDAICEISERQGQHHVAGWREATPYRKQGRDVSKAQAAAIAGQARKMDECEILFDHNQI